MSTSDISSMLQGMGLKSSEISSLNAVWSTLPQGMQEQIKYNLKLMQISKRENILMVLPFYM
jgi:hypothetical protein